MHAAVICSGCWLPCFEPGWWKPPAVSCHAPALPPAVTNLAQGLVFGTIGFLGIAAIGVFVTYNAYPQVGMKRKLALACSMPAAWRKTAGTLFWAAPPFCQAWNRGSPSAVCS